MVTPIASRGKFQLYSLTSELLTRYSSEICASLDLIPSVEPHTLDNLLATHKGERVLHHKFEHSLLALVGNTYAGIIIGYERAAEGNEQYRHHSIYLSDLAVSEQFQQQGLGTFLVATWLEYNSEVGFLALDGELRFSVQTNKAPWNTHVQKLYQKFGFQKIAEKQYENRVDNVYLLETI